MTGKIGCWYLHHRMKWTIIVKSVPWYIENLTELTEWMRSEHILKQNIKETRRIYLYSEEQLQYFILRWS